ncbi:CAP domain-containing protein [Roseovarius faecimaris]|nr:CAP domain-containing protein [Roseovarius faecimaris]
MPRPLRNMLAALMALGLSGCMSTVEVAPQPRASIPASGQTQVVSAANAAALNSLRAQYGLPGLRPDATLGRVADGHARDMIANGFFGHVSSNGNSIVERTRAQGYAFCHVAENLAMGQRTFDTVLQHWMTSPSHRSNLLHREVTGFGLVRGPGNLWVLVLGRPGC